MAAKCPERTSQAGFTLLEVMAAIAILGIGVVTVIQLFSGALGLVKSSQEYTGKVLLAREKMDETLSPGTLSAGKASGVSDDGLVWAVEVRPYGLRGGDGSAAKVFEVGVSVEGQGMRKRTYTLTTLKTVF